MGPRIRITIRCLFVALLSAGIILSLLPASLVPASWMPFVSEDGEFAEKPTRLTVPGSPGSQIAAFVRIDMHEGICEMTLMREDGSKVWTMGMGQGTLTDRWDGQSVLILDGRGGSGKYLVFFGPRWHPFAPRLRVLLLVSCLVGLGGGVVIGRRSRGLKALGWPKLVFAACIFGLSCLLLYSVVHEFGHVLFGSLLGGDVARVVWTIFSGEEPHVSFSHLPEHARPWMGAGGILLPTLVGLLLVCAWLGSARRLSWYVGASILLPGLSLLLGNLGLFVEVFGSGPRHLHALTQYYAVPGWLGPIVELSPAVAALLLFAAVWHRLMKLKALAQQSAPADADKPRR